MALDNEVVYRLVEEVPAGEVASYGMIASLLPGVTARMVGRALGQLPNGATTPWHRIVNATGAIAPRPSAAGQRKLLLAEGINFRKNGFVDWSRHRWRGPSPRWFDDTGADYETIMETIAGWR